MGAFWHDKKIRLYLILLAVIVAGVFIALIWTNFSKNQKTATGISFPVINQRVVDQYTGRISAIDTVAPDPSQTPPSSPSASDTVTPLRSSVIPSSLTPQITSPTPVPTSTQPALAWPAHRFPRTANYYLVPTISDDQIPQLAKFDILITGAENQLNNPEALLKIREANPHILIFAYVDLIEFPIKDVDINEPPEGIFHQMLAGIDESWWLRDRAGNYTSFWPGARLLNITEYCPSVNNQKWQHYVGNFSRRAIIESGLWDGIFFDEVLETISWLNDGNLDINNDGRADSAAEIDRRWQEGSRVAFRNFNAHKAKQILTITNGGDLYYPDINGNLFEGFPNTEYGDWNKTRESYLADLQAPGSKGLVIIHAEGQNENSRQTMRYGLATTLLGNGYFAMSTGPSGWHDKIWWFDEYDLDLGQPLSEAQKLSNGVWQRSYEKGLVLVNPTDEEQGVKLNRTLRTSGGDPVSEVHIWAKDGVLLQS